MMYRFVENNVDLWANLGWEKGGKELWDYIKDIPGLEILSAPMAEGSKVGKRIWVERELGLPVEAKSTWLTARSPTANGTESKVF